MHFDLIFGSRESFRRTIFVFLTVLFFFPGSAADIFVSVSGNDKNTGSFKAPFATITRAAKAAKPGDTVRLLPGIFRGHVRLVRLKGAPDAPISFKGTRGQRGNIFPSLKRRVWFLTNGLLLLRWGKGGQIYQQT